LQFAYCHSLFPPEGKRSASPSQKIQTGNEPARLWFSPFCGIRENAATDKTAIRWLGKDSSQRDISYRELAALTSRFAHLLERLDVAPGERVFSLLGRVPELYVAACAAALHQRHHRRSQGAIHVHEAVVCTPHDRTLRARSAPR
jgi:hypothetical protein